MPEPIEPHVGLVLAQPFDAQLALLGVTDQDLIYRDSLMQVTSHMIGAALRTPYGSGFYERMSNPGIGDLVMEYTRGWWSKDLRIRAWSFGVLVGQRHEFWGGPDERGFRNTGTANYIRWGRGKGDVQRWENSQMMLIPIERDTFGA